MKISIITTIALFTLSIGFAQSAEERGLQIAKAAEKADLGFGSSTVELKMTLKTKMVRPVNVFWKPKLWNLRKMAIDHLSFSKVQKM